MDKQVCSDIKGYENKLPVKQLPKLEKFHVLLVVFTVGPNQPFYAWVAHMRSERWSEKPQVVGSTPTPGTSEVFYHLCRITTKIDIGDS